MAGTCEYGNELSGSIKCGEFLDLLQNQLASQEGLCAMEQVCKFHISSDFISSLQTCNLLGLLDQQNASTLDVPTSLFDRLN